MPDFSAKQVRKRGSVSKILLCVCCAILSIFFIAALFSIAALNIPGADKLILRFSVAVCLVGGMVCGVISGKFFRAQFILASASILLSYLLMLAISLSLGAGVPGPKDFLFKSLGFLLAGLFGFFLASRRKQTKGSGFSAKRKDFRQFGKKSADRGENFAFSLAFSGLL